MSKNKRYKLIEVTNLFTEKGTMTTVETLRRQPAYVNPEFVVSVEDWDMRVNRHDHISCTIIRTVTYHLLVAESPTEIARKIADAIV
jgi:hypothetical protein